MPLARYCEGMMTLRAGSVGRVSKDKSGEARSVAEQHEGNRAAASEHGWAVTALYEDVMSASRFAKGSREDWLRLLQDVGTGGLDVILLWEASRGSRRLGEWIMFLDRCRENDVLIHVTTHRRTYDMNVRRDRKALIEDGTDAEDEVEKTSERVRRALAANREAGMPHSKAPFGYKRVYDERGKLDRATPQVIDEGQADIVRKVIRAVAAEIPLTAIERETCVQRSTIRKWVANPTYIGKVRTVSGLVDARWEPIVSEHTWRQAQAVLAAKPNAGVNSRPGGAKYLLSGIMTCAVCDAKVDANSSNAKYHPPSYECRPGAHVAITRAAADRMVTDLVMARCSRDDLYQVLTAASGTEAEQARAEAIRLQVELDEWLVAGVSARAYKAQEDRLLPLIAAARERADRLTIPVPVHDLVTAQGHVAAAWQEMPVQQKRAAIRFLFDALVLKPAPRMGYGVPARERIAWQWRTFES